MPDKCNYNNLKAELVRINLDQKKLAVELNIAERTLSFKLSGKSPFTVDEMWFIKNKYFPNLTLDYLFQQFRGGD